MTLLRKFFLLTWIGLCAAAMLWQTRLLFGVPLQLHWLDGFVFGGAVFGYAFSHPDRVQRWFACGMGGLAGLCWLMLPLPGKLAALAPGIIWLLYYGLRRPGNAGLRARPWGKPLAIALAWSLVTVLLPLDPVLWSDAAALLLGRATFIFALALAYDLCDLAYDQKRGLSTLALQLGREATLRVIALALLASALCVSLNFLESHYTPAATLALLLSLVISGFGIFFLTNHLVWAPRWQKAIIDGLMLAQFLLVWGVK